jgi:3-dehydroquinate synthetase/shikimate kinase
VALVLIGFMGAGKSTIAGRVAERRGASPLDSDTLLAERFGHSIAREFELHGEESFRAAERELVCRLLADAGPRDVVALGGGSVLSAEVRAALAGHVTALIDVEPGLAWERVQAPETGSERPLARDRDAFEALYRSRRDLYEQVADTALLWAQSDSGEYPVFVGDGLLGPGADADGVDRGGGDSAGGEPGMGAAGLIAVWPLDVGSSRPYCVTDTTVGRLYGERLRPLEGLRGGALPEPIAIEPGERHKTLACAETVWTAMARAGMTRADHVVALGGGVVGDLAGFCAATYQRGVPVVHLPTTLVAQVDSAYGGKTGVDLPEAKNYVGAYHQPAGVIADPGLLATLPAPELAAGWVEVLKTALIAGGELWERVSNAPGCAADARTIRDCAATKLRIVREDERDAGARQLLNLGHTVGHAIETVTGYARYRHGEAIGLGLLAALRLSGADRLREQVRELLAARGLPVTLGEPRGGGPGGDDDGGGPVSGSGGGSGGGVDVDEIVAATARDKKRVGAGGVPFVLARAPGAAEVGCEVPEGELRAAVKELAAA